MSIFYRWLKLKVPANIVFQEEFGLIKVLNEVENLLAKGLWQDATQRYRASLPLASTEIKPILLYNLGVILSQNQRLDEAEEAYRSAINLKPDFVQAWFNLGSTIENAGRKQNAITIWQSMLEHPLVGKDKDPEMYTMVLNAQGRIHEEIREFEKAEGYLLESMLTNPAQPNVIQHWVHLRQKQCKWPIYQEITGLNVGELIKGTSPLSMLSLTDDPGLQLSAAMRFVYKKLDLSIKPLPRGKPLKQSKIKIGFLSSDFCLHAVSLLTVELIELIDRSKFEVIGICWSKEDGSDLRKRMLAAFDAYIPIHQLTDEQAAQTILNNEVSILIDLHGITSGARPNILSYRPAPVQITYLGFPGTTGHPCIDYVIADKYLAPYKSQPFYTENIIYMPHIFQCSDSKRPVGATPKKADYGLPEDQFIFCSFNNNYKITPDIFSSWMTILKETKHSILWLLEDNKWAKSSLIEESKKHGIDPNRLYFAGRITPENYLARYKLADLFLDCFPFNGGTTVNDAMWVGLPVLTLSGRSFASRMAGSLLSQSKQENLICFSHDEYVTKAIQFYGSHHKNKLTLVQSNSKKSIFNTKLFAADFENEILKLYKRICPSCY